MELGFEFEFFSGRTRRETAAEIGRLVRKKVRVADKYHSEQPVGKHEWKLEPDFSGGIKLMELITEPMEYQEAMAVLSKVLAWIRSNGWTDERCAMHVNISFDRFKLETRDRLEGIDRLKFVLGYDEQYVYDRFPKRKNSIYARSINSIIPVNRFVFSDVFEVHPENYELPNDKYYGINFTKLAKGYFEVRYIGGRGYERKIVQIKEIIDYTGLFTYDVLQHGRSYSKEEVSRLKSAMRDYRKVVSSFSDVKSYFANFKDIKIMVDLKGDLETVKTFYPVLRDRLFDLIVRCGMKRGVVNYDADLARFQVKDAKMMRAFPLRDCELFDCELGGNIINCDLFRCTVTNAHLVDCNIFGGNNVSKSKLLNSPFHAGNVAEDCYIDNRLSPVTGAVVRGIIRSGDIGATAKVSDETEIIDDNALGGKDGGKDSMSAVGDKDAIGK